MYWREYMRQVRSGERGDERLARLRAQTNAQNHKPKNIATQRRKNDERRAYLHSCKCVPCADCGETFHPVAMDFDHRDGTIKLFDVGTSMQRNWEMILAEIAKCDVVCSNCHRIRTYNKKRRARQNEETN
jgi:hypothetical protein